VDPEEVGLQEPKMQRARDALHEQVESGRSPGLVSVVARRGEIALAEAIGNRNRARPIGARAKYYPRPTTRSKGPSV
jgi:hypothetical protein